MIARDRGGGVFEVHRDYVDWTDGLPGTPICRLVASYGYPCDAIRDFNSNQEMGERCIELIPRTRCTWTAPRTASTWRRAAQGRGVP